MTPDFPAPRHGTPFFYQWADGSPAFVVVRREAMNGHDKKSFVQHSLHDGTWVAKQHIPAGARPLYGLPALQQRPEAKVLVVEGEKKCEQARILFPEYVVTCWAGGAKAVQTADWSPLQQRHVTIWPDNDGPGIEAADALRALIPSARIVDVPLSFPEGWDLADDPPPGWTYDQIVDLVDKERPSSQTPTDASASDAFEPTAEELATAEDPLTWIDRPIEARRWLVQDYIPIGTPTLYSGHGGTGKSYTSLQLAHAVATGTRWLGLDVQKVCVLAVLCEDDKAEIMRRLQAICTSTQTSFGDLENLHFLLRDGLINVLQTFDGQFDIGKETRFYEFLLWKAKSVGAQLIVLDSLYNFFAGDQNSQTQVHQFVNLLKRLAKEIDGAVLLLGHPSKSALSSGEGYSGSVVWHDAVRSRLYLNEEDGEDGKRLLLKTMKANYGPKNTDIEITYDNGIFIPLNDTVKADPVWRKSHCDTTFLDCLRESTRRGRHVTDSKNASNFAPKIFATMDIARGFKRDDFTKAMERLFNDKRIQKGTILGKDRKPTAALVEVEKLGYPD